MKKFQIFKDRAGGFRWRLIAGNGQIVAASESYTTKHNARRSTKNLKASTIHATIIEKR